MVACGGWMVEIMEEGMGGCMMNGWIGSQMDVAWINMDGCMFGSMVGWLTQWLVGWLVEWLVGWLVCWLVC